MVGLFLRWPHICATSSGLLSLNSPSSPSHWMTSRHSLSVNSSNKNCHSCIWPLLPVTTPTHAAVPHPCCLWHHQHTQLYLTLVYPWHHQHTAVSDSCYLWHQQHTQLYLTLVTLTTSTHTAVSNSRYLWYQQHRAVSDSYFPVTTSTHTAVSDFCYLWHHQHTTVSECCYLNNMNTHSYIWLLLPVTSSTHNSIWLLLPVTTPAHVDMLIWSLLPVTTSTCAATSDCSYLLQHRHTQLYLTTGICIHTNMRLL